MRVPRWLIPVLSIVAALAVGIAASLIGIQFASPQVVDQSAGTVTVPVSVPIATGLTSDDAAKFIADGLGFPLITGQSTISQPGGEAEETPLQRTIDGLVGAGATPAAPTPSPSPNHSNAEDVGVTAYDSPTGDDDPCSPADGAIPEGCPDGLHSAIFGLTARPTPDYTISPFDPRCGTDPIPVPGDDSRVDIPVLFTANAPFLYYHMGFTSFTYEGRRATGGFAGDIVDVRTPPDQEAAWEQARVDDTPVADLPSLYNCVTVPSVLRDSVVSLTAWGSSAVGSGFTALRKDVAFSSLGHPLPRGLEVLTLGSGAIIASGELPEDQQLQVRAYDITRRSGASCDHLSGLHQVFSTYSRTGTAQAAELAMHNIPADYTNRTATGFIVKPGSTTLLCGRWFNGADSPSFERTTPLQVSSAIVQAPDAILPQLWFDGFRGSGVDSRDLRVTAVDLSVRTAEGVACGGGHVYSHTPGTTTYSGPDQLLICDVASTGFDTRYYGFEETDFSGDLALTMNVTAANGNTETSTLRLDSGRLLVGPDSCIDCLDNTLDIYPVALPGIRGAVDSAGEMTITVRWHRAGLSGFEDWAVTPVAEDLPAEPASAAPQLNTDNRLLIDTARSTSTTTTARLDLQSSAPADYTVTLESLDRQPACTTDGSPAIATGHLDDTAVHPVYFANLCFGTQYLANVTLTNSNGTTNWGADSHNSDWLGYLLTVRPLSAAVQFTTGVTVPGGQALTDLDFHLDRQELDAANILVNGCVNASVADSGVSYQLLGPHPQLHVQYRLRQLGTTGCTIAAGDTTPPVDAYVDLDLAQILATPGGVHITVGAVDVLLQITPRS